MIKLGTAGSLTTTTPEPPFPPVCAGALVQTAPPPPPPVLAVPAPPALGGDAGPGVPPALISGKIAAQSILKHLRA